MHMVPAHVIKGHSLYRLRSAGRSSWRDLLRRTDSCPPLIVSNAIGASGFQQLVACFIEPVESGPQVESGIGQLVASRRVPLRGKDSGRPPESFT